MKSKKTRMTYNKNNNHKQRTIAKRITPNKINSLDLDTYTDLETTKMKIDALKRAKKALQDLKKQDWKALKVLEEVIKDIY